MDISEKNISVNSICSSSNTDRLNNNFTKHDTTNNKLISSIGDNHIKKGKSLEKANFLSKKNS